jgi:peptide/nickel transport system ATP-binding protein
MSILEVKGLTTHIQLRRSTVQAVDNVSFSVGAGETLGVVGESGCGKSMTGNSIMRLLPPGGHIIGGEVLLEGRDLVSLSEDELRTVRGNEIGMIFQDPMTSLNPTMSIGRQIGESVRLHRGAGKKEALDRAAEVLSLVGMPRPAERLDDYPHQLSGGLRQRVVIAMALACEPKVLIADEPTTALDVTIQAQILNLLDDLKDRLGTAIVLITHDMGVIAGRADRTMVMYAGQVVEQTDTVELFSRMRHPYTEALLSSIPQIDQDATQVLYSIPGLPPDLSDPPAACRFAARCRYVQDRCRTEVPPLGGDADHRFACFYPTDSDAEDLTGAADRWAPPRSAETAEDQPVALLPANGTSTVAEGSADAAAVVAGGRVRHHEGAGSDASILLSLEGVSKEFAVTSGGLLQRKIGSLKAVTDVSIDIRAGETFGLVGESGCGKTTLGRMMVALEHPSDGRIRLGDIEVSAIKGSTLRRTRADLQIMFQDPYASLDPRMPVGSIIQEPLTIQHRGNAAAQQQRVRELIAEVGLAANVGDRYPHEFSGGQRQRIGLARALALNPKLIVADEPVSALDVSIRSQILNLMRRLQDNHDLTYVVISHDLSVVRYMADRIGVMYLGKLVEVGTGDDIYVRTAHPYTAGLLSAIPVPRPQVERAKRGAGIIGELPSPLNPPSGCRFRTRCPRAETRCADEVPALRPFGGEHLAACHFPLQTPVELTSKQTASSGA